MHKLEKLGKLGEGIIGLTYSPQDIYEQGTIVLRSGNIQDGRLDFSDTVRVNKKINEKLFVNNGDILICSRNGSSSLVGKSTIINQVTEPMTFGAFMMVYRSKYNFYLKHFFNSQYFKRQLSNGATTTINQITKKMLDEIEVPLPTIGLQNQISKTLDVAADLLSLRKQQLAELDNLIKSTFCEMFGDPVTNSKGWNVVKLSEFYKDPKSSVKCGPFGSALKKEEYVEHGVPVWVMDNITKQGEFIDKIHLYVTEQKYVELEQYNVQKNDIIISRAGTVGKMCVVTANHDKSIISTNLIRLRLNEMLFPSFLVKLITIWGNRLSRLKKGNDGAFTHMNTGVLDNICFPYPPLSLQQKFASIEAKIEEQKTLVKKAIYETQLLFDSLMSKYFD
ncbi:restriction endonuclease subunit S [Cohnella pontilimi]|uniref:Restriction endonuclease subunit S n=1 Tax=Cohnella pontilimi TaxID=2564100 RepID=A0A4U0FDP8_9BACL|nr:restriction endonuclease subunit S [Cohnella pontilimi]TJY42917.1 restriction endonuclease subunit S [Cohnella pontilimi]